MTDVDRRLRIAVRSFVDIYREIERAARVGRMTIPQYKLLLYLRAGPQRAGELAALAAVKKPTITPIVATLEDRGWVAREADPDDRRSSRLMMTDEGRFAMNAFESELAEVLDTLLPEGSKEHFYEMFDILNTALYSSVEERLRYFEFE
ncbi:MarR family winged helix-turn-helix transcriptional regulator [Gimibacter soli]|uniref:MarR family transcriptional regulator n=1 Tax=Gimibacter soli TaxID=3024400 RepID=A0AAE9XRD4_9PROT|nr:MarR family transcriptional regulator [Gimibacter soli]WCL53515.1 MarR family transcriptional regulator [Gimibacter soli]